EGGLDDHFASWTSNHAQRLRPALEALGNLITFLKGTEYQGSGASVWSKTTLLVFSEFSRTPRLNASGGRDHHLAASCVVAGPSIRGNLSYGATSDRQQAGEFVDVDTGAPTQDASKARRIRPAEVHHTLLHSMGLDTRHLSNQTPELLPALPRGGDLPPIGNSAPAGTRWQSPQVWREAPPARPGTRDLADRDGSHPRPARTLSVVRPRRRLSPVEVGTGVESHLRVPETVGSGESSPPSRRWGPRFDRDRSSSVEGAPHGRCAHPGVRMSAGPLLHRLPGPRPGNGARTPHGREARRAGGRAVLRRPRAGAAGAPGPEARRRLRRAQPPGRGGPEPRLAGRGAGGP